MVLTGSDHEGVKYTTHCGQWVEVRQLQVVYAVLDQHTLVQWVPRENIVQICCIYIILFTFSIGNFYLSIVYVASICLNEIP